MPFDASNFVEVETVTDSVLRELIAARTLLADPKRWAQGDYCVGDAFCMYGAIRHVRGAEATAQEGDCSATGIYLAEFVWMAIGRSAHIYNDALSTTHEDVLALYDRAIAARRAEQT